MLTPIEGYQLEWNLEYGPQCRYKLLGEAAWSGWVQLKPSDSPLVSLLLSQQPVFYNQLTGTLSVGAAYATEAASPDNSDTLASDIHPIFP